MVRDQGGLKNNILIFPIRHHVASEAKKKEWGATVVLLRIGNHPGFWKLKDGELQGRCTGEEGFPYMGIG